MWPQLIANKILRRRLGSNNFVADFSGTDGDLSTDTNVPYPSLCPKAKTQNDLSTTNNYRVFVSTWNVGGIAPHQDMDMEELLDTRSRSCDIYVIGFQEVVPLNASNVLGSEKSKISAKWNSLIRETLNKKASSTCQGGKSIEGSIEKQFRCIISKQMVGIFISVWIRTDLRPYIRHPSVSCVGCGIMSCLGNKGSVSVRFQLHETNFCFICSHLASGGGEGDEKHRNSNVAEIFSRTSFPKGPSKDLPCNVLEHDRVILLGDLNYRISLPEEDTRLLVERRDWNALLKHDQLTMELAKGRVFEDWHEGKITFAPTYKYCPNSDEYYGCFKKQNNDTKRAPAWCDRIIWYGKGLKQHTYDRGESRLSDHRPVRAIFTTEVSILHGLKGLQNFFISERFDRITSQIDQISMDTNFLSKERSSFQI